MYGKTRYGCTRPLCYKSATGERTSTFDGSSKDGYMKLKTAKDMIDEWVEDAANLDPTDPNMRQPPRGRLPATAIWSAESRETERH